MIPPLTSFAVRQNRPPWVCWTVRSSATSVRAAEGCAQGDPNADSDSEIVENEPEASTKSNAQGYVVDSWRAVHDGTPKISSGGRLASHKVRQACQVVKRPHAIRQPSLDRGRRLDRDMLAAEVVIHEVERPGPL